MSDQMDAVYAPNITELFHRLACRPPAQAREPLTVAVPMYLAAQDELLRILALTNEPMLMADIGVPNFLLGGVAVCPAKSGMH